MRVYKTQQEVERNIKDGVLAIEGDVKFECSISIFASIKVTAGNITAWNITAGNITAGNITAGDITAGNINAWNITAGNITAGHITAGHITAGNITAGDITAGNINAGNINAGNINAGDINARDITAWNITAWNITAGDILYYAFCCVYKSIKCFSIKAKREISHPPICLEGKIEYKNKPEDKILKCEIEGQNLQGQSIGGTKMTFKDELREKQEWFMDTVIAIDGSTDDVDKIEYEKTKLLDQMMDIILILVKNSYKESIKKLEE